MIAKSPSIEPIGAPYAGGLDIKMTMSHYNSVNNDSGSKPTSWISPAKRAHNEMKDEELRNEFSKLK